MAVRNRAHLIGGALISILGLGIMVMSLVDPSSLSEGVPPWIGVGAGGAFLMAGLAAAWSSIRSGNPDGLVPRALAALLLSMFALAAMIFPPSGLFVGFLAVLAWIHVYRRIHERVTGRDPLLGTSNAKLAGLGCLVTTLLILLVILVVWLLHDRPPREPLLPELMPGQSP